jgi:glutamate synthase (NADPH/NADH) small chain
LGTALRQGARTVTQLEIMARRPMPGPTASRGRPWPELFKVTSAHEEGGERLYEAETKAFLSDQEGRVRALEVRLGSGEIREIPATLVLVAAGFVSSERQTLGALPVTERGSVAVSKEWLAVEGENELSAVFACGDAVRGQSLIVWALAEGRSAASAIDAALTGARHLPAPVVPGLAPWSA